MTHLYSQQLDHLLAPMGLSTRQQVEHLQAQLFVAVMFMLETLVKLSDMFRYRGPSFAHGLSSAPGPLWTPWRAAAIYSLINPNS